MKNILSTNKDPIKLLRFCKTLPTLPGIALKIIDLANDPDTDILTVCEYISLDPALSAKILKTANSPLFKTKRTATNIRQAVNILGTHSVIVIALSFSLSSSLIQNPGEYSKTFDNNKFWRHSITSALASRALGEKLGLKSFDDLFLAALLQEIGILAFNAIFPNEYGSIYSSTSSHEGLLLAERENLGIGHDELGYELLKQWHIPNHIAIACIASHNKSGLLQKKEPTLHACVAVSQYIASYMIDLQTTEKMTELIKEAQSWLQIDESFLVEVIDEMQEKLHAIEDLFDISIFKSVKASDIISEAKELLTMHSLVKVQELEQKSQRDGLTGAYNRAFLEEVIQREFNLSKQLGVPLTIAMLDLDHFKRINDTYGHTTGDTVLVSVVHTIHKLIRHNDLLCRYGGEEFTLIFPGMSLMETENAISRIKDAISSIPFTSEEGSVFNATASVGVAALENRSDSFSSPQDMLKAADQALYTAKRNGRNRIVQWNNTLNP
ncbi:GGDEF domain-containing protein [Nitrosomonas sp.]|uniref:sensor domain-containing diguanylate cyclase n=1 Tax=Nitrosomonas sp. TaxID=42353 RepID=UPI00208C9330|nr:GGDEF domain-containing protein [Nitrosomonas sp.]GJL76189.1 MAG: hypothetical protein NMNS02_22950 [Nitrosomonas sp.]